MMTYFAVPPHPSPLPPQAGGEGVNYFARIGASNVPSFSLSPNGGEGQGEGESIYFLLN